MTHSQAEQLGRDVAADLHLPAELRHVVVEAARRLVDADDLDGELAKLLERHRTTPKVAGAIGACVTGIRIDRTAAAMTPAERERFEAGLYEVGGRGGAFDSGAVEVEDREVEEALANAERLEAGGDRATAARIRAAADSLRRG